MTSVNIISLLGRVGNTPNVRHFDNNSVANFSLATTETYKDKSGDKKEETQWHNCVAWGKTAEVAEKYVHKGDQLYVSGKLVYEQYEKENVKHTVAKIRIDKMVMLGGKRSAAEVEQAVTTPDVSNEPEPENDLPF